MLNSLVYVSFFQLSIWFSFNMNHAPYFLVRDVSSSTFGVVRTLFTQHSFISETFALSTGKLMHQVIINGYFNGFTFII